MSLMSWLNMGMVVDIACAMFFVAVVWKLRVLQKEVAGLRSDLILTIKNPAESRRRLKQKQ